VDPVWQKGVIWCNGGVVLRSVRLRFEDISRGVSGLRNFGFI
jgi:hypothetical protein